MASLERVADIGPYATNITDYVAMDGSNNIAVTADIHDMAGAQAIDDLAVARGCGS